MARPGALTAEYFAGRRVRYLPPLRLFMATGIVMVLVYSFSGDSLIQIESEDDGGDGGSGGAPAVEVVNGGGSGVPSDSVDGVAGGEDLVGAEDGSDGDEAAEAGPGFWERFGEAVVARVSQDPERIREAFGDNLPRMMFLFLPLAAGMLMILYLGSDRRYVEHLLFSLHAHAFVFLGLSAARSLRVWVLGEDTVLGAIVAQGVFVWMLVYFFLALRRVYGQGRLVTSVKFIVLVGGYGVLLTTMLVLTVLITVFVVG